MKAKIILADAASAHPDGTFSLLRGGITECYQVLPQQMGQAVLPPQAQKYLWQGALLVRITGTMAEKGRHTFKVVCMDEDGGAVAPELTGGFDIPPKGGSANLVMNMQILFPKAARYTFAVTVDSNELDTWTLTAKPKPKQKKKKKGN